MNTIEQFKERLVRLLAAPREELGGWARFCQMQIRLWRFCARQLRHHNALAMSAALSFRTIFAMVPTIILAILMLQSFGFRQERQQLLDNFLHESGLDKIAYRGGAASNPAGPPVAAGGDMEVTAAEMVRFVIQQVEDRLTVGALGPIGVVLLIWTALTLLTTMERSLNRIFEASRPRPLGRRVLMYWSVLTLAPLALLAASYLVDRAAQALAGIPVISWVVGSLGWLAALLCGIAVLAALYQLMPNTRIGFRAAITGAVVAFPLWLLARWAFALYVERVATESLYGAMGLIPLFLMWLNASWWIFLFGGQLAYTAANLDRMASAEKAGKGFLGPWDLLATMVAIARANAVRPGPVPAEDIASALAAPQDRVDELLGRLTSAGFICRVADEQQQAYLPAAPVGQARVADILRVDCAYADPHAPPSHPEIARAVRGVLARSEAGIENLTVADIIQA